MITAALVKELRERTNAGMMDCKHALTECEGDMEKAIDWLRKKGISKAQSKANRIAAEGLTRVEVNGNKACVIEINSETDFVAKNDNFQALMANVNKAILGSSAKTVEEALAINYEGKTVEEMITDAVATIGEHISLRRFALLEKEDADIFGTYIHMGGKISSCVVCKNTQNAEIAKDMAMQVASMNPSYVSREAMPQDIVAHERSIQEELLNNDESLKGKPEKVLQGIIEGRLSKSLQDMCLVDQIYFKNQDQKVAQVLKEANTSVSEFVRYQVGEGLEKREENFAEEVAKQIH